MTRLQLSRGLVLAASTALLPLAVLSGPSPAVLLVLLVVAGLTMFTGVVGAAAQYDIRKILSFHIISQIGYMVMGLALFSRAMRLRMTPSIRVKSPPKRTLSSF